MEITNDDSRNKIEPQSIVTDGFDIRKSVFIIPVDAPLPNELADAPVSSGSLYQRIAPLTEEEITTDFALVPLAGNELLALDRAWTTLVNAPRIYVLLEIPGAKYDILFTQARRQLGLRSLDWPTVSESIAERVRTVQRTTDKTPWALGMQKKQYNGSNIDEVNQQVEPPKTEGDAIED